VPFQGQKVTTTTKVQARH